jgi:Arc/MetJ family transcription regulator
MARTNIDIDEEACAAVMKRYGLKTKRDAVNLALRSMARQTEPMTVEEVRAMWGTGWDGDLASMRDDRVDTW